MYGTGRSPRRARVLFISVEVARVVELHELVAVLHLLDHVVQHSRRVLHVGHHRHQQMRDAVVVRQLDLLGVDHDHAHLLGRAAQEHRRDQAVDAAALARAGGAGDEQMRQPGQVGVDGLAGDVLAQPDHERPGRLGEVAVDVAQGDEVGARVGHLDAHGRLAGDRRKNADLGSGEGVGQIVLERRDLRHLGARSQMQLVSRDAGTHHHADDPGLHPELSEGLDEHGRGVAIGRAARRRLRSALAQHVGLRKDVRGLVEGQLDLARLACEPGSASCSSTPVRRLIVAELPVPVASLGVSSGRRQRRRRHRVIDRCTRRRHMGIE